MMELPHALSPWSKELELFPREVALALGALAVRLSNLIGARRLKATQAGAPDGYDGITTRGSYDRLLATEWALLDVCPEEFIRRSVAGEQAFLRRAFRERGAGLRCVALFDSGIEQLGAPRLVQLALLVVLARRAELQHAQFEWGVLQDEDVSLQSGLSAAGVRWLLAAHCARSVTARDVERWQAALPGLDAERGELWIVGGESVSHYAAQLSAAMVMIRDLLEPGPQRVHVSVSLRAADRPHEAVLELPPGPLGVRMLREPFWGARPPRSVATVQIDARVNLVFSSDSRRLYARGAGSSLLTFQVPNSPNASTPGAPVVYPVPDGHTLIAVGRSAPSKRTCLLSENDAELFLHVLSKRGASSLSVEHFPGPAGLAWTATQLMPLGVLSSALCCFIDASGQLVELSGGEMRVLAQAPPLAARSFHASLAWISLKDGVPEVRWAHQTGRGLAIESVQERAAALPLRWGTEPVYFGEDLSQSFAYQIAPNDWMMVRLGRASGVSVEPGTNVAGIVIQPVDSHHAGRLRPVLFALDAARLSLDLLEAGERAPLFTSATPILQLEVDNRAKLIAMLTEGGELVVLDAERRQVVARWEGLLPQ